MELSRRAVPLYGRVKVCAVLQTTDAVLLPEDAEFYIVLEGSSLNHIAVAQRAGEGCDLNFIVPGHNLFEMVSVMAYLYTEGQPVSCLGKATVEYIQDDAQELAEFLVTHAHCLSVSSHQDIAGRFSLSDKDGCRRMDEGITQAMANLDYPYSWNVLGSQPGEELQPRESLLHIAVRLGLPRVLQLLLCQPGGLMAVVLPNEEGDTPLKLAEQSGQQALLELLTDPPNPLTTPLAGMSQVWADSSRLLRFCHESERLTLTVQRASDRNRQAGILQLRKRLKDDHFLREIKALSQTGQHTESEKDDVKGITKTTDFQKDLCGVGHVLEDNVFEEQLVLSLDEEEEPAAACAEKSPSPSFRRPPDQSTFSAAARLSAMLNGKDQIYANAMLVEQVGDSDIKYSITGVTGDSTLTDGGGPDTLGGAPPFPADPAQVAGPSASLSRPPHAEEGGAREQLAPASPSPCLSPVDLALARLNKLAQADVLSHGGGSPQETCALSPSLVALEVDSEEDELLEKSAFSHHSTSLQQGGALQTSSGDERDSFDASLDLCCSHAYSSPLRNSPLDSGDLGLRLRSYSYSSPKISSVRPRCDRHVASSDLTEDGVFSNSGRSLLQALSLSKSLSLLNPIKHRAFSLPEQPQEKRELTFRKRAQSAEDEGRVALAESLQHLTLSEFLKEIEEEEWDKYIIPSKAESEKYKVSRTFSFLKSRMSSTRNKNKGKAKEKEGKEKSLNGHQFATGSCTGLTLCLVCDKPAVGKDLLQCSNCGINVHKGCRDSVTPCMKKLQEKYVVTMKNKTTSLPQNTLMRENPITCVIPTSTSLPAVMCRDKREQASVPGSLSKSAPIVTERLSEGPEIDPETVAWRSRSQSEELLPVTESSPSTDSSIIEDVVDASLRNDFREDLLDYEAESWSLAVDHKFCKKQEKRVVKRQDVIYELMQTEMHHIQTLTIMAEIFRKGMREELQLDLETVDKIFPCLDELFDFHKIFFCIMKERRQACTLEHNSRNFLIDRIGDILVHQFSHENAEKMKQVYGEFCSHHTEAVSFFKELQQQNKKFQLFIKQQSNNSLVRRKEIPECILLVTQRITKYPVLLERILQYSQEGTEEHADLSRALALIREVIVAVDLKVSDYNKEQKLLDILNRMENKTLAKLKNGQIFRKQDLLNQTRTLKHEGLVYWKTATGRLKDILALLLTDTLIFLQEKDQKFIFAAVDQKPPVISLQKLIVREVANEERGMFLISASAAGPEMYEVHTSSKEERNTWMRLIREAVESCPEEEEEINSESEEDKRAAEARAQKIQKLQETLNSQDQQICSSLEEKLRIYTELARMNAKEDSLPEPRLLIQANTEETPQAAMLLAAALREAEKLTTTLTSRSRSSDSRSQESLPEPGAPVRLADSTGTASIQDSSLESDCTVTHNSSSVSQTSDLDTREVEWTGASSVILSVPAPKRDHYSINLKVAQSVQSLTQLLYSLQAAVTIQDSCFEVQRVLLQESGRLPRQPCPRANALQEQEKQRNLEKQREELAGVLRLQGQLRQERQRWERECDLRRRQQEALESRLEARELECQRQAQRLRREREELEGQLREYQQSLERLRDGQRLVSREREKLDAQQRMLQSWRHNRQRSLPVMMIPLDGCQDSAHGQYCGCDGNGSVFVNEAALHLPLNNRQAQQHQRSGSLVFPNGPSTQNNLNSLIGRPAEKLGCGQQADGSHHCMLTHSQSHGTGSPPNAPYSSGGVSSLGSSLAHNGMDLQEPQGQRDTEPQTTIVKEGDMNTLQHNVSGDRWPVETLLSSPDLCHSSSQPVKSDLLISQPCVPVETENGEDGSEENIVYL
ncbi:rho guanine nucleotide exchange factor 28 isoform X2 [Brienomyrus brachyistius]|uniref:rho guanine nucleotide exchange factor 28 isoform X2 n=1 Tax=Brienomyrus brachyistius TaxID=42636 RepID=UPI0020B391BB|nr:rho guanine nucleotide exchange factor 28 isoform X2 [Brienomyrus brachyistius]